MKKLEELLEWGGTRRDIVFLILSGIALAVSIFDLIPLPFDAAWAAIIFCGLPIILEAVIGLVTEFDIKADVLVSAALIASVLIGEDFAAGEVAFIMQLGGLLEELTVARARAGIERLVQLTPRTARVMENGRERVIPAELVKVGDLVRVLPGEAIPVDGIIKTGQTSINQAVMTGESLPVDKGEGDEVFSGTVNQFGSFDMTAVKVGEDSSIQRMIRLVQSADAGKAKIVGLADRWATWIVVIALTAAFLTWIATGQIIRSVTILVVFCPCALVLATPTAIMAAIGNATKHGFLVREGDALERLSMVSKVTFDKTGTLTYGTPRVTGISCFFPELDEKTLYAYAASAEKRSEHPLGKAIVKCFQSSYGENSNHSAQDFAPAAKSVRIRCGRENPVFASLRSVLIKCHWHLEPFAGGELKWAGFRNSSAVRRTVAENMEDIKEFQMLPGHGVKAVVGGKEILAGNERLMAENHIELPENTEKHEECTMIYLAIDRKAAGCLALSDTLRPEAAPAMKKIREMGIVPVLLTGDHRQAALYIAGKLDIDEVCFECLPEDKLQYIDKAQQEQKKVCMIGDGVNDAPALKRAWVGIAMGGIGSDIAVDAADIALVNDDIKEIPHLLRLSRRMMKTIRWNLTFSMALNFTAIALAITGILNPVVGALVHNAGSVFVIVNSALLLAWKEKK